MWIKKGSLSEYKSAVKSNNRKWSASLLYNHNNSWGNEVDKSNIKSFSVSDYSTDGSNITMGCVAGSKATINLINVPKSTVALWKDGETKIKVALNLDSANVTLESVPCVIDSKKIVKRLKKFGETENRVDVTLTAYDVSYLMTYNFRPSFTKGTALEFVAYIADKYNLLVGSSVQNAVNLIDGVTANRQFDVLSDLTDKQTLGYMAGCYGCYAYINNYNEIEFGWYKSNGETVAPDRIFESGFYVSDMEQRKIVTLETGTQNNVLTPTVGGTANGYSIKFENPYINQAQVNAIYNQKIAGGKTSFRVGKIKYKGDPLNVPGTILSVEDIENETATFYVMKRTLNYDGGLSETIECQGESESTIKYKAFSPMQQKIDKAISRLEEAAKGATDVITQTKGGVFELTPIDPDNPTQGNKGFTITATEETNRNNKIVANIGGIGFSTDGGETIDAAAIYFDKDAEGNYVGRINAELIEAGSIGADKLQAGSITADKIVTGDMANLVVADPVIYNTWNGKTYEDPSTYLTYFSVGNTASTTWGNDVILNRFYGADTFKVGDKFRFRANVIATVANLKMVLLLAAYNESGQKIVNLIDHRITLASGNQSVDFVCEVNKSVGGVPVAYHQVMVGLAPGVMGNFYFRNASLYKMTNGVLIEDGAITAEKIAAGSITTDLIDSDVLTIGNISGLSQGLGDITSALEDVKGTADDAYNSLVELCVDEDLTIVDGAKIATGTITADKVAIGSVNDLSNADPKSQTWGSAVGDPNNANATFPDAPYFKIVSTNGSWGRDVFLSKFASHSTFNVGDKFKFRANARFVADNAGASGQKVRIAIVLRVYYKDGKNKNLFSEYLDLNASSSFSTISHECTVSSLPTSSVDYYVLLIGTHTSSNNGTLYFNNTSCIQMSNNVLIADGAITADKIEAEAVTADKLSVGTGVALNQFYNDEFYDGTRGWYGYNGVLNARGTNQSWAYMEFKPNDSGISAIMQKLWLVNGQRYAISAQIYPLGWSKNASTYYIRPFYGVSLSLVGDNLSSAYNYNGETVIKLVFDYNGNTGFVDTGIAFRGIMAGSTPSTINIAWMSFSDATNETVGFYCTRKEWLANGYKDSNYLGGSVNNNTTADAYLTQKALTVDASGNLVTLGTIKSNSGEIGSMFYNRDRMDMTTHSYYLLSGEGYLNTSRISFVNPPVYTDSVSSNGINTAEDLKEVSPYIEVVSVLEKDGKSAESYTAITPDGVSVSLTPMLGSGGNSALTAFGVEVDGVLVTSRESSKKKIAEKSKVLSAFKSSKIYEYKMKYDDDNARAKTGFVIERETPEEVLSDDGKHINLYSMASLNWKATQEILERVEALEQKAVNNNVEQT